MFTTYKASVSQSFFSVLFFLPEIRECVNDDTKNEIKNDNNYNKVEEQIIKYSGEIVRLL